MRRWLVWPAFVGGSALAYVLAFANGMAELSVFGLPLIQVLVLLGLERWLPAEPSGRLLSEPQLAGDLTHNVVGSTLGPLLGSPAIWLAGALAVGPLAHLLGGAVWPSGWPLAAQAALAIVLGDGLERARHAAFHRVPRLWRAHAVHHDVDRLWVLKSGRTHFLDMAARSLLVLAPLALLGAPGAALLAYPAAINVVGPICHANLDLRYPAWLHRWIVTPPVHRLHHARPLALSLRNLANVLPFWDLLLGTFTDPARQPCPPPGIEEGPARAGVLAELMAPLRAG